MSWEKQKVKMRRMIAMFLARLQSSPAQLLDRVLAIQLRTLFTHRTGLSRISSSALSNSLESDLAKTVCLDLRPLRRIISTPRPQLSPYFSGSTEAVTVCSLFAIAYGICHSAKSIHWPQVSRSVFLSLASKRSSCGWKRLVLRRSDIEFNSFVNWDM